MRDYYLLALAMLMTFSACEKSKVENLDIDYGYEYFPLSVGNQWIYAVDSAVVYGGGNDVVMTSGFIKEEIIESISEEGDYKSFLLERSYSRDSIDGVYKVTDRWTIASDHNRAYKTEENLRFVKLVFPVKMGVSWDGNAFIDTDNDYPVGADAFDYYRGWNYKYQEVGVSDSIGGRYFNDLAVVSQIEEDDFLRKIYAKEVYARGVGLVSKEFEAFASLDGKDPDVEWLDAASKGLRCSMRLIDFNVN